MNVLERLPDEEMVRFVQIALGQQSPDNPAWQLWTLASFLTCYACLPEDFRGQSARLGLFLVKTTEKLRAQVPRSTGVFFSLLVKVQPWFSDGLLGRVLRRAFPRLMADVKKRNRELIGKVRQLKRMGRTQGEIALDLNISVEAVKGVLRRHKP
jgi:hypothetical protein